jgi:CBS domain containing-hemolysin-like protein
LVLAATLIVAALIAVNAVYVAAEFAAVSVRRSRIQQLAADGNHWPSGCYLLSSRRAQLDRYIAACQIGITLSSLVLGAYAQGTIAVWLQPLFTSWGGLQGVAAESTSAASFCSLTVAQVIFRGAGAEVAGAAVPHPDGALHADPDGALALGVPAVHQVAERHRDHVLQDAGRPRRATATSTRRMKSSC